MSIITADQSSCIGVSAPAERLLISILVALGVMTVTVANFRGQAVDWLAFAPGVGAAFVMIALGFYVRAVKGAVRVAHAAVGFGVFMAFSGMIAILIFSLFPFVRPTIDADLIALDARLGYDWAGFVAWVARVPLAGTILGYVYHTSIPQIAVTIALLAALNKGAELHRFLFVGVVTMFGAVAIWSLWPSIGPSAYTVIPADMQASIGLVFGSEGGARLLDLAHNGVPLITPDVVNGVIAFPSYHMVMAWMVMWYCRTTPARWPALILNFAMIPATLSHGAHHLIDLIAATVLFFGCVWLAYRLIPDRVQSVSP
ncbi:MAG: phosphatase PAP2 family protein [Paracoccaceae bacterium]